MPHALACRGVQGAAGVGEAFHFRPSGSVFVGAGGYLTHQLGCGSMGCDVPFRDKAQGTDDGAGIMLHGVLINIIATQNKCGQQTKEQDDADRRAEEITVMAAGDLGLGDRTHLFGCFGMEGTIQNDHSFENYRVIITHNTNNCNERASKEEPAARKFTIIFPKPLCTNGGMCYNNKLVKNNFIT